MSITYLIDQYFHGMGALQAIVMPVAGFLIVRAIGAERSWPWICAFLSAWILVYLVDHMVIMRGRSWGPLNREVAHIFTSGVPLFVCAFVVHRMERLGGGIFRQLVVGIVAGLLAIPFMAQLGLKIVCLLGGRCL